MLSIILDAGVVPAVWQSDNEFCNLAFEELCSMLGGNQLFSTALNPKAQGIIERKHLDMRRGYAICVEELARVNPRRWPRYTCYLQSKLRHLDVQGATPYQAVHGFAGSTALESALGAFEAIPSNLVTGEWLRSITQEAAEIGAMLAEHWTFKAKQRARRTEEKVRIPDFEVGELVLLHKAFYEKGTGAILPQNDGPFVVSQLLDSHSVRLEDALTGTPFLQGKPIGVTRLIRYKFPRNFAEPFAHELTTLNVEVENNSWFAVEIRHQHSYRIFVAKVIRVFRDNEQFEAHLYHVPSAERFGPWARRVWAPWTASDGTPKKEVCSFTEIVTKVELNKDGVLTQSSLSALAAAGVDVGIAAPRSSGLPPRIN